METSLASTMAFEGRLQQWNDQRGFGFIEVEATRERVFVHASALPRDGMRPATGARLAFDVERDPQGRQCAVNVRLADARNAVPRADRPEPRSEPPPGSRAQLQRRRGPAATWAVIALVAVSAVASWRMRPTTHVVMLPDRSAPIAAPARPAVDAEAANRRCDGRTHCSQMTSCEEATWFLAHCEGAKMDGDHNGVPCEQQWCSAR